MLHKMKSVITVLCVLFCLSLSVRGVWISAPEEYIDSTLYEAEGDDTWSIYSNEEHVTIPPKDVLSEDDIVEDFLPPGDHDASNTEQPDPETFSDVPVDTPEIITVDKLAEKVESLVSEVNTQKDKIINLESANKKLQQKVDQIEQQTKTNSVIFFNVRETKHESHKSVLQKVLHVINRIMKVRVSSGDIAVALRAESNSTKHRPIVVRFTNFATKMKVLGAMNKLRHSKIVVVGDYSEHVAQKRKELLPYLHRARAMGQNAFLLYDKLMVNGVKKTLEELRAQEERPVECPQEEQETEEVEVPEEEVDPENQDDE